MDDCELFNKFKDLFCTYHIGNISETPVSIQGGLMHKMYKVTTETRVYAIKWLNPSIMQRNGVLKHMIQSERIASYLSNYLPVVAALSFEGNTVLQVRDSYFIVYPWIEGRSIFPPEIREKDCFEIGNALGKIHQLNIFIPEVTKEKVEPFTYVWKQFKESKTKSY